MGVEITSQSVSARRGRWPLLIVVVLLFIGGTAFLSRGHGYKTRIIRIFKPGYGVNHARPAVTMTRPGDGQINVLPDAFVAADVHLPVAGRTVDGATLNSQTVHLYRTDDHTPVAAVVNTSGGGDAIVLKPVAPLELNTRYSFEVTSGVKDTSGASFFPFTSSFITAASANFVSLPIAFEKVALPVTDGSMFTCVEVGPDHRLYASTLDGRIISYQIGADGTLADPQINKTIQTANNGPRLITGIKLDPTSTAREPVLWVSHGELPPLNRMEDPAGLIVGAHDWTGKISQLRGPNLENCIDYVIHTRRWALPTMPGRSARSDCSVRRCCGWM
jgi:hypothetical protein